MLAQHLRCWHNIKTPLFQLIVSLQSENTMQVIKHVKAQCRANPSNTKKSTLVREDILFSVITVICNGHSHDVDPALNQCCAILARKNVYIYCDLKNQTVWEAI